MPAGGFRRHLALVRTRQRKHSFQSGIENQTARRDRAGRRGGARTRVAPPGSLSRCGSYFGGRAWWRFATRPGRGPVVNPARIAACFAAWRSPCPPLAAEGITSHNPRWGMGTERSGVNRPRRRPPLQRSAARPRRPCAPPLLCDVISQAGRVPGRFRAAPSEQARGWIFCFCDL